MDSAVVGVQQVIVVEEMLACCGLGVLTVVSGDWVTVVWCRGVECTGVTVV